jgi:hypothetical protein
MCLAAANGKIQASIQNNYILPLSQVEFSLSSIIEELTGDPKPVKNGFRAKRATGVAVAVAQALLQVPNKLATSFDDFFSANNGSIRFRILELEPCFSWEDLVQLVQVK